MVSVVHEWAVVVVIMEGASSGSTAHFHHGVARVVPGAVNLVERMLREPSFLRKAVVVLLHLPFLYFEALRLR